MTLLLKHRQQTGFDRPKRGPALWLCALACFTPSAVGAETTPDCTAPSGISIHSCTFPDGQIVVETSLADWTEDHSGGLRTTSILAGDTLVHVGLTHSLEAQVGWTPYDYERTTNRRTGVTTRSAGIGDVSLGGKLALLPDSSDFDAAVQASVELPVGKLALGGKDPGGSLVLSTSYDLSSKVSLELTPEADYLVDRNADGRHLYYGVTLGTEVTLGPRWSTTAEYRIGRDRDPAFHRTEQTAALSFAFSPTSRWQVSSSAEAGLNRRSPRLELTFGIARHFL